MVSRSGQTRRIVSARAHPSPQNFYQTGIQSHRTRDGVVRSACPGDLLGDGLTSVMENAVQQIVNQKFKLNHNQLYGFRVTSDDGTNFIVALQVDLTERKGYLGFPSDWGVSPEDYSPLGVSFVVEDFAAPSGSYTVH